VQDCKVDLLRFLCFPKSESYSKESTDHTFSSGHSHGRSEQCYYFESSV